MRFQEFAPLHEANNNRAVLLPTRMKRWEMLKKLAREIAKASVLPKPTAADQQIAMRMYQQAQATIDAHAEKNNLNRTFELTDDLFGR